MAGCSKDDPSDPDNLVADPQGTITVNISEDTSFSVDDRGYIHWNKPDNLCIHGHYKYYDAIPHGYVASICNLGKMKGLGNVTYIPQTGFSNPAERDNSTACEAGHGYVVKLEWSPDSDNSENKLVYVRLYVVEPIVSTLGGIMGAKVKYQYPFKP
jgi:hypothetical protein